ncbi:hypothetical protein [Rhizobium multihospitium]|uniref:Uncharacterized protein n=1 Tax=Rhizobium multihospitium TaxID=410764 RepID=A0A1C3WLP2_9HYPH|nr:hypothetical protein [Rhizobium multihospitium]SCB40786.1 hypothetical protein GA0061103_5697 [Rhizobium multihospitium]
MNPTPINLTTAVAVYESAVTVNGSGDYWVVQISADGLTHVQRFEELAHAQCEAKHIILGWNDGVPSFRGVTLVKCVEPIENYQAELAKGAERDSRRKRAKAKEREYARQQRIKAQPTANAYA